MTRRTSFLTRCFALVLALVMTFSGSNLGIVLQAFAEEPSAAMGLVGDRMVAEYSALKDTVQGNLLTSAFLNDNEAYNEAVPTSDYLTINGKTVAAGAFEGWTAGDIKVTDLDGNVVDLTNFDGAFTAEVTYTQNTPVATVAQQQDLIANIKTLDTAYDNVAAAVALKKQANSLQGSLEMMMTLAGETGNMTESMDQNIGPAIENLIYLNTMIEGVGDDYVRYLLNYGDALETVNEKTGKKGMILEPVGLLIDSLPKAKEELTAFAGRAAQAREALETANAPVRPYFIAVHHYGTYDAALQAAQNGEEGAPDPEALMTAKGLYDLALVQDPDYDNNYAIAEGNIGKLDSALGMIDGTVAAIAAFHTDVKGVYARTGWVIANAVNPKVGVEGGIPTTELNNKLAGLETVTEPEYKDIYLTHTLTKDAETDTLIVNGSLTYYDAKGEKRTVPEDGLYAEKKVAAGTGTVADVAKFIEDFTFTLQQKAADLELDLTYFNYSDAKRLDANIWDVTYTPKQFNVTIDGKTTQMDYGYHYDLPSHANSEKMYIYTVTGEGTANAETIRQGGYVVVDCDLTITSDEQAAYFEQNLMEKVAEHVGADEDGTTILKALKYNKPFEYRKFNKDGLVTLGEDGKLTAETRDGWTAVSYQKSGDQNATNLPAGWGVAKTAAETIADNIAYVDVNYALLIASMADVNTYVGAANGVIGQAVAEKDALAQLNGYKGTMGALNKGAMTAIAALADANEDMPQIQKDAFAKIVENCYDGNGEMKLYNLLVEYEKAELGQSAEATSGLQYFYIHAAEFNEAVDNLSIYLNDLLTDDQTEMKELLGEEYNSMANMQGSVGTASGILDISPDIAQGVDMSKLGEALNGAAKIKETTADCVMSGGYIASVNGEGVIELTVNLNVAGESKSFPKKLYKQGQDTYVIDAAAAKALDAEIRSDANISKYFGEYYENFYTSDYNWEAFIGELTNDVEYTFTWTEKVFKVTVGGKTKDLTVTDREITLPGPGAEGESYEYVVGDRTHTVKENNTVVREFSENELLTLFVDGAYTVERTHYDTLTLAFVLNVPVPGKENRTISAHRDFTVVKDGSAYVEDAIIDELKSQIDSRLVGIQKQYYNQDKYNPDSVKGSTITADKTVTHNWSYKTYTVVVPGMDDQTISLENLTVKLKASDVATERYEYVITIDGTTHKIDSRIQNAYEFDAPGNYVFQRNVYGVSTDGGTVKSTVVKTIAEKFVKESNVNAYDILNSGAFTIDTEGGFDESIDWDPLSTSAASRSGTMLNISKWQTNSSKGWAWTPVQYDLDGATTPITAEDLATGTFRTDMAGIIQATVDYELSMADIADAAVVSAKLKEANALYARAQKQKTALDGLVSKSGDLNLVATLLTGDLIDTEAVTDPAKKEKLEQILTDVQTNCLGVDEEGKTKLKLSIHLAKYGKWDGKNQVVKYDEDGGLSYFYREAPDFIESVNYLCKNLNDLVNLGEALDEATNYEYDAAKNISEYAPTIVAYQNDLPMEASVDMSENETSAANREKLGQILEDILDSDDSDTRTAWVDVVDPAKPLVLTDKITVNGDGGLYVYINVAIEDQNNAENPASVGFQKTTAGDYVLNDTDLAKLNGEIKAELEKLGYVEEYYEPVDGKGYEWISQMTLTEAETELNYAYQAKKITVKDILNNTSSEQKPVVADGYATVKLPASTDANYQYAYYAGAKELSVTNGSLKMDIADFYGMFQNGNFVIDKVTKDQVTYTIKINVPGFGDVTPVTYSTWKPVGSAVTVPTASLHTDVSKALKAIGYNEATDGKYYENADKYTVEKLPAEITENDELTIKYSYKKFPVYLDGVEGAYATQYITKDENVRKVTLPKHESAPLLRYEYYINGEYVTDATYTFEDELFESVVAEGAYTITRIETDTVDYSKDGVDDKALNVVATEVLTPGTTAYNILTNEALVLRDRVQYLNPTVTQEKNVITIDIAPAHVRKQLNWTPYQYRFDDGPGHPVTGLPMKVTMGADVDNTYTDFRMTYMKASEVQNILKIADELVADARDNKKPTLDYLSSDEMASYFDLLKKDTVDKILLPVVENGEFSEDPNASAVYREYYKSVFQAMVDNCYVTAGENEGKLALNVYLQGYKGGENPNAIDGIAYFYANANAINAEISKLSGYLDQLVGEDVPAEYKQGLQYFLANTTVGEFDLSSAYNRIDTMQAKVYDAQQKLALNDKVLNKNATAALSRLGETLDTALSNGYTNVQYQAKDLVAEAYATNENVGKITITMKFVAEENALPTSAFVQNTFNVDDEELGTYTIKETDIAILLKKIVDKTKEEALKDYFGEGTDLSNAAYYVSPCTEEALAKQFQDENGDWITFNKDYKNVDIVWELKDYFVEIPGVEKAQTINLKSLDIELPASKDPLYFYSYMIKGKEVFEEKYTFGKADLGSELFDANGICKIERIAYDARDQKLIRMVNSLNEAVGIEDAFTLLGEPGKRTGIHGKIPADGMMGMAMGLLSTGYDYVGLNGKSLYADKAIHMQAMIDAMLSDAKFGSETIIALSENKTAHVMTATMQLGNAADDLEHSSLEFTVEMEGVPADMKEIVNTVGGALKDMRSVFRFTGSGDDNAPELKTYLNMTGNVTLKGKTVNLEKVYEAYLTAMLATLDRTKTNLEEINQKIAFQFLWDYTKCLAAPGVTVKTLENTLAKLGQDVDLSEYANYFKYAQRFYGAANPEDDGLRLKGSMKISKLIEMSGKDLSAYETVLNMIYEHKNGIALKGSGVAILENANHKYEAVILDPKAFDKSNIASVQNTFNYTTSLDADAQKIAGEAVIMLLSDVEGHVVLNNATILDLNGKKINGTLTANGRTIIIDSASEGYVETVTGNATLLAGTYGKADASMLRPGYTFSGNNNAVTVNIESMLSNGYYNSVPFVAAEMATSIALNHYASAAFYACASTDGSADPHTIYELGVNDFISLIDREDTLKENAVNIANTILNMVWLGDENGGGVEVLINEIAGILIDVDRIVELTKTGGTLGVIEIATKPWKFETKHIPGEDYITAGLTVNSKAEERYADFSINIPQIENTKIQRVLNELADIAAGTAGAPESFFKVDLKDITLANNTVNIGGGLETFISLNFCGDDDGDKDYTDHGDYNRMLAVIVAFANDDLTEDIIKNGEIVAINELMAVTTVGDFFDAIKNAVNSDKPFDFMVEKIGAKLTAQQIAKLSKLYEKFQAGAGKVLAKFEAKAPMDKQPLSFLVNNDGVLYLQSATYSGTKAIKYKGYGLNFNLTDTSVGLKIKFCTEQTCIEESGYKLRFNANGSDVAASTVLNGMSFYINDKEYKLNGDYVYDFGAELEAWFNPDATGGDLAITYTYEQNAPMLTPDQMFVWKITKVGEKVYEAKRVPELDNILDYVGCSVWLDNDGVNGLQYHYYLDRNGSGISALAGMGYTVKQLDTANGMGSGDDHGTVIDWKYIKETGELNPNKGVIRADKPETVYSENWNYEENGHWNERYNNSEPRRVSDIGTYYGQAFPAEDEKLVRDQNIRFYLALEDEEGNEFILYSGTLERDILTVAQMVKAADTEVEPYKTYVNNVINNAIAYGAANPNVK